MEEKSVVLVITGIVLLEKVFEGVFRDKKIIAKKDTLENINKELNITAFIMLICAVLEFTFLRDKVNFIVTGAGIGLIFARMLLKNWTLSTLDEYSGARKERKAAKILFTGGPYRFIRHPLHLTAIMEGIAVFLILNAYITLTLLSVVYLPLFLKKVYLEEAELINKFGKQYLDYKNTVFAFFPIRFYKSEEKQRARMKIAENENELF